MEMMARRPASLFRPKEEIFAVGKPPTDMSDRSCLVFISMKIFTEVNLYGIGVAMCPAGDYKS